MRWIDQPVFFIDFEGSQDSGVLEYGIATLHGGRVTAALTRLCAPTGRVRTEDTEIHGLEASFLASS
ncbi:MAG TPA: 3'-5' exonuclease, partial [Opitutaceae bacterium]